MTARSKDRNGTWAIVTIWVKAGLAKGPCLHYSRTDSTVRSGCGRQGTGVVGNLRTGYRCPMFQRLPDLLERGRFDILRFVHLVEDFFSSRPGKPGNSRGGRQRKVFDRLSKLIFIGL